MSSKFDRDTISNINQLSGATRVPVQAPKAKTAKVDPKLKGKGKDAYRAKKHKKQLKSAFDK